MSTGGVAGERVAEKKGSEDAYDEYEFANDEGYTYDEGLPVRHYEPDLSSPPMLLFRWIAAVQAVQYEMESIACLYRMTVAQTRFAQVIARRSVGIPLVVVADELGVSPAAVTQMARRMRRKGLVEFEDHSRDGRCHAVYLTEIGHQEWARLRDRLLALERAMRRHIGDNHAADFEHALESLRDIDPRKRYLRPEPQGWATITDHNASQRVTD